MSVQSVEIIRSRLTRGSEGHRHEVVYVVTGSGLKDALDQVVPHGTESGQIPGIFALDFAVESAEESARTYYVTVTYRRPDPTSTEDIPPEVTPLGGTIQLGARLQPTTFVRDKDGNPIKTEHTFNETQRTSPVPEVQPAEVEGFIPTIVMAVTRTENDSPLELAKSHVGKLNDATFFGEPALRWLCTAIEGVSEDNGGTYQNTYEFELNPNGWGASVVFIDPKTSRPPEVITDGVELQTYDLYDDIDFGDLNLE